MNSPGDPEGPQNHHDEYEQYLAHIPPRRGPKLTFAEKCGLAWALKKGEHTETVVEAFGLSRTTISKLRHCLQPHPQHYSEIWEKYEALGPEVFKTEYFTRELYARLTAVRRKWTHLDENQTHRAPRNFGPDPHADRYAFHKYGPVDIGDGIAWRIEWKTYSETENVEHEPLAGWWPNCDPRPGRIDHFGAERVEGGDPRPFNTSALAFDAIHTMAGLPSPRTKPGRPKKSE